GLHPRRQSPPPANFQVRLDQLLQRHRSKRIFARRQVRLQVDRVLGRHIAPSLFEAIQDFLKPLPIIGGQMPQTSRAFHMEDSSLSCVVADYALSRTNRMVTLPPRSGKEVSGIGKELSPPRPNFCRFLESWLEKSNESG